MEIWKVKLQGKLMSNKLKKNWIFFVDPKVDQWTNQRDWRISWWSDWKLM